MKQLAYPKYKPSKTEWIGNVPEHWTVKAIKWESPVLRGASPRPIDDPKYFDDEGEYAWVRISDVTASGMYLQKTEQNLSTLGSAFSVKLEPGSLFLSIAGSVGKPCITKIKCCIHDGFVYFPRFKGDQRFLYYIFASGEPYRGLGKLGTQLNLNTDTVGSVIVGFPQREEQCLIADYLDRETVQIDNLVEKKWAFIEKLKEKRTALVSRAVTRGLPPNAASVAGFNQHPKLRPSGIEWLGDVPQHWDVKSLKRIVSMPITDGPHESPEFIDDGIPFASAESVWDGKVHLASMRGFISPEAHRIYARKYLPRRNDVFMVKSGSTTGRVAIVDFDDEFNVWSPLAAIRCDDRKAVPKFIYYAMSSEYFQGLVRVSWSFGTQPNIGMDVIENLSVVVPPIPEQRVIADYLDRETEKHDALIAQVETAIARLQEYRIALITAAITGKIDVRKEVA